MRAMRLEETGPAGEGRLRLVETPVPQVPPEQALVRVTACGVCHTDLHIIEGELPSHRMPVIPGHQVVGTVERSAGAIEAGTRVGIPWLHTTCGRCRFCIGGKENLCPEATFTGYDIDGGYAQFVAADEKAVYPLPAGLPDLQAAPLLCAGVIGYRSLNLAEVEEGGRLGLYGFGASAHIVIQIAVHLGYRVYVFSRTEEHRRLARELGAVWTGSAADPLPEKLHGAIIFAPAGWLVPAALEALERGGTVSLAGIYMTPVPQLDYSRHLYHEKTLRSVANSTREDVRGMLRLAEEIPIRTEVEDFPLEDANEALVRMKEGRVQGAAVLRL